MIISYVPDHYDTLASPLGILFHGFNKAPYSLIHIQLSAGEYIMYR